MPNRIVVTTETSLADKDIGTSLSLRVLLLASDAKLPLRVYPSDAGWDVFAYILTKEGRPSSIMVPARDTRSIPTKIAIMPPEGYFTTICSRSGLAKTRAVFVANAPAVVDPGYRGEIPVILFNGGSSPYWVQHGDRVAQLVVLPLPRVELEEVDSLPTSDRGDAGFGSSGR
jgi:dUTP pyrophosphatase